MRHSRSFGFYLGGTATVVVASLLVLSLAGAAASRPLGLRPLLLALTGDDNAPAKQATRPQPGAGQQLPAGPQEKVKVHGDWTIEVRNPDGSLASRHQFANSLVGGGFGDRVLNELLTRAASPGKWRVLLGGLNCTVISTGCVLVEPSEAAGVGIFNNLSVRVPTSGPNALMLELQGRATVPNASTITDVNTSVGLCSNTTPPSNPCSPAYTPFTTRVTSPIGVQAGQIVTVTVAISFQ